MDWIEVTARTVDEAKELALDRLGVVEDELEYEVVDEPSRGLFRRSEARIRARVKPLSREKPSDRRRGKRPNERPARGARSGQGSTRGQRAEETPRPAKKPAETSASRPEGSSSGNRRRRDGRGRSGAARTAPGVATVADTENSRAEDDDVETVPVTTQAADAAKFTEELVRVMGFPASVRTEIDDEDVTVHVEGDGLGALVGPRGVTLHALEEVVRAVVQHRAGGHSAWIHVDVGGYRERRRAALAEFARTVATEVSKAGMARALEPMNAADRKVVHDTVAELEGVGTVSEGEDPRRRVVIRPE